MRAYEAHSVVPPAARTVPDASHDAMYAAQHVAEYAAQHGAKMMPALYNPSGGRRVQLAWQRFSISQWWAPCAAPRCDRSDGLVQPAACQ